MSLWANPVCPCRRKRRGTERNHTITDAYWQALCETKLRLTELPLTKCLVLDKRSLPHAHPSLPTLLHSWQGLGLPSPGFDFGRLMNTADCVADAVVPEIAPLIAILRLDHFYVRQHRRSQRSEVALGGKPYWAIAVRVKPGTSVFGTQGVALQDLTVTSWLPTSGTKFRRRTAPDLFMAEFSACTHASQG